ncbi:MAG: extracellular solute-binding protein [Chthoniobacterales bacterium]|nr:extracellular solute-binding protein [Chthoniobacterales bacterium]
MKFDFSTSKRVPRMGFKAALLLLSTLLLVLSASASEHENQPETCTVEVVDQFFNPNAPWRFRHILQLMEEDPALRVKMWSGLKLPGGGSRAPLIMAIAGETAPDILDSWFHVMRTDIHQGFLYPLNQWIGDDLNGNGEIDPEEARWEGWNQIPELWRKVATVDGKVYGLPQPGRAMMGVLIRTDLARNAGLDPDAPPKTWDEFHAWAMKLSDPGRAVPGRSFNEGQRGIALLPYGFTWLPWVQSAGGTPIVQVRIDPHTGKAHEFPMDATQFVLPDGTNLADVTPEYRARFDSPAALRAAGFLHRLRWSPWIVDPATGEEIALTEEAVRDGRVEHLGKTLTFPPEAVLRGVAWAQSGPRDTSPLELLGRGDVAMMTWFVSDLNETGARLGLNPELLSWFPFPAETPDKPRVVQVQQHFAAMCVNVGQRSPEDREQIWRVLKTVCSGAARDQEIERLVVSGLSRFVSPRDLQRLGFTDTLRDVPPFLHEVHREIDEGIIQVHTEPYLGFWNTMDGTLNREVLSLILAQTGEHFDYAAALKRVTLKANNGVMFARSTAELARYRLPATLIFGVIVVVVAVLMVLLVKSLFNARGMAAQGAVKNPFLPWLLLFPALFLIGLWGYYPLLKGMVMAFQDFRIAGESPWVGLDNFISIALDRSFWGNLGTTVYFVAMTMLLSFTTPILLAVALSEVPRGKIFYRTLFFLPQVTSGLVIALMWKMMYDPKPNGLFNQILSWVDALPGITIGPQSWLLDPKLAMFCVVLPTAWATAGIQSLIYLAALKGVPEDTYEACEIDGGGIWTKLRHITLPILIPLIIINFVGAFIATFQNMGNIFLLTFGGPGESTMVAGMRIWIEAYGNLRFSIATSMAWVVGAALIGFTFVQMQMLKRVEFRRTKE